jgi:CheY-like chemotaxis protein
VISSLDEMLRRLIGEDIKVETIITDHLPLIKVDRSQLEQIFVNLVVNARDALHGMPDKDHPKRITIETGQSILDQAYVSKHEGSHEGPHVFFAVSDNGIGMDEETRQKVFEPFFTTKEKHKGTGLGLSMVYGIVKQNQGSIYLYSEPGQGTTIKIYWPVSAEENETIRVKDSDEIRYGRESILIVEDEKEVCRFAADSLSSLGYKIFTAGNGQIALDLIKAEMPRLDLIITDLVMPELNGKEFVKKVHQILPDIKVIYVSGYTDNHIVHNGLLEEGVNFIQKPYSLHMLSSAVRQILDKDQ